MKILLDACVWGKAKETLVREGHDVVWAGDWAEDPGDLEILSRAHKEHRVLVTLDKDFGELAIVRKIPPSGIIRLVNISTTKQADICHSVISLHQEMLHKGALITVEADRIRIRPPD
jgi:predicted nuclease of predicted toxin-antitoxin system